MPRALPAEYRIEGRDARRFRCLLERRAAAGVERFRSSPRSCPTRSGPRTTSRSSRSSTPASTTCASPPGTAVPPAGPRATPAIMLLPGYQMDPPIPKEWARKGYVALSVAPRGKLRSMRQFNPGLSESPDPQHRGSAHLRLSRVLRRHLARHRFPAVAPGGRSDARRGDGQQSGRRPDHHHRRDAARGARGVGRRAVPLRLRGRHRADAHLSLRGDQRLPAPAIPSAAPTVEETVAYFDGINFADRIACPIIVNIGLARQRVSAGDRATRCSTESAPPTSACIPTTATATTPGARDTPPSSTGSSRATLQDREVSR